MTAASLLFVIAVAAPAIAEEGNRAPSSRGARPGTGETRPMAGGMQPMDERTMPSTDPMGGRMMQQNGGTQMGAGVSCCPPGTIQGMMHGPIGVVVGTVVVLLIASIVAVLIALAVFLVRRSRTAPGVKQSTTG
jgi:hypothetical protein